MNFKQKLAYMFIGCLFTIAGYILASLGGMTTHAQQDEQVLDKIVCKRLEVVNEENTRVLNIVVAKDGNGAIFVNNAAGKEVVNISATEDSGSIGIRNAAGKFVANIFATTDGNGGISVHNAAGKEVAVMGVDKDDDGVIETYKNGWRTH